MAYNYIDLPSMSQYKTFFIAINYYLLDLKYTKQFDV